MANAEYLLGRGYVPATRLNLQQVIWRDLLGYSLHPRVTETNSPLKIADVGTGTGVWLCHVASFAPSSWQLHGFDISEEQFMPKISLPPNVKLDELDATTAPPSELRGTFDVVHVRLLQIVVNDNEPSPIIDHCLELLKPDGHLQWDEFDPLAQVVHAAANESASMLRTISSHTQTTKPVSWIRQLPEILSDRGLSVIALERQREKSWQRMMLIEINAILSQEFAKNIEEQGHKEQAVRIRELIDKAYEEGKRGSYVSQVFQVVVAQKQAQ